MPIPISTLETSRLILRPLRMTDAPCIQKLFPHWKILEYMAAAIPWPYPDDGAETFLASVLPKNESGEEYHWAITCKSNADDALIGVISLTPQGDEHRGFWLAQEYHRRGYMKEAVLAVTDFAFYGLGLTELRLGNAERNIGSHRLKEIAGAIILGIDEDVPYVGGRFRHVRWLLTREAWDTHRATFLPPDD